MNNQGKKAAKHFLVLSEGKNRFERQLIAYPVPHRVLYNVLMPFLLGCLFLKIHCTRFSDQNIPNHGWIMFTKGAREQTLV